MPGGFLPATPPCLGLEASPEATASPGPCPAQELPGSLLTSSRGTSARPPAHHLPQQERGAWLRLTSRARSQPPPTLPKTWPECPHRPSLPILAAPSADPAHLPCCRPSHRCSPPGATRVCLGHSSPAGWRPGPQGPRSRMPVAARTEGNAVVSTSADVPNLSADPTGHGGDGPG